MRQIGIAIVGCGGISLQNHLPGFALCRETRVVALCDTNPATLEQAARQTGVKVTSNDCHEILGRDDVDAVVIATPNLFHKPIALAAIAHGKHVLCEKPLAMSYPDALEMAAAAEAAGVRHMTAFTYRFVPAMRYLAHLVAAGDLGQPFHYRSCRLQDWGTRDLGWRQVHALAGTGELGDMLSHRIDFALRLVGPMRRLVAQTKVLVHEREGAVSDLDDWAAMIAEFAGGATGVLESSKLAHGRNEGWRSLDYVELNGSEATCEFTTGKWDQLQFGKVGGPGLAPLPVPREFWVWPGSPRDPAVGDPLIAFRYDQAFEFIDAIRNQRPCTPSFHDGARVQAVLEFRRPLLDGSKLGRGAGSISTTLTMSEKTAVVTGAGSGAGAAIAQALAREGWRVALIGRRLDPLTRTAAEIPGAVVFPCDVGVPEQVAAMAAKVLAELGTVEVLVNAAGTNVPRRSLDVLSLADYHAMIDANMHGAYYCAQAFLPHMRQRGSGTIVNIVSEAGKAASPKAGPGYVMSKFGLAGLTQAINAEERARGLRACSIFAGDIDTPLLDKRPQPPDAAARAKMMQPEDIARCVRFVIELPPRAIVEEMIVRPA